MRAADTRHHLLLRPGENGRPRVAIARSPPRGSVLEARSRRLRSALLLRRSRGWPPPLGCPLRPGTPRSAAAARLQPAAVWESFGVSSPSRCDVFNRP